MIPSHNRILKHSYYSFFFFKKQMSKQTNRKTPTVFKLKFCSLTTGFTRKKKKFLNVLIYYTWEIKPENPNSTFWLGAQGNWISRLERKEYSNESFWYLRGREHTARNKEFLSLENNEKCHLIFLKYPHWPRLRKVLLLPLSHFTMDQGPRQERQIFNFLVTLPIDYMTLHFFSELSYKWRCSGELES